LKCQPCGQDNASSALFCTACRRPLVAPTKLPTRLESRAHPAMAAAAPGTAAPYGGAASPRNRFAPPEAARTSRLGGDADVLTQEEAWSAFLGDANRDYYMYSFSCLANGERGGWNWGAFFLRWYWMLYRKMWLAAVLWYFVPTVITILVLLVCAAVSPKLIPLGVLACFVYYLALPGLKGNAWYYKLCQSKIRSVRARGGSKDQMLARLEAAGGTSNIIFIFMALLALIAGIGILAAVALPAYQGYTVKAKVVDALPVAMDVANAVGKHYEETGQLPAQFDVDGYVLQAAHRSKAVNGIDLDSRSATLTVHLSGVPGDGSFQLVPSSDNNHHLSWTCTSSEKMSRFMPASCRS